MRQAQETLNMETAGPGLYEITGQVTDWTEAQGMEHGLLSLFCAHSSASLIIQENADPAVLQDLEDFFWKLAPEGEGLYRHSAEGTDDMPAHIKAALTATSLSIPLEGGRLVLGIWQGVYLYEHRTRSRARRIHLHLLGD
ncbi:MAG: secondary thiamine-phosphate synthase enzyme YjbQ [Rhodospirillales bacterium]|jgi:secondary thiamine-phosphate synthase enzyme|nr:secondary thiamine-phosphate synthase enzyme YjbQ [Rhodospirillales bacterium]